MRSRCALFVLLLTIAAMLLGCDIHAGQPVAPAVPPAKAAAPPSAGSPQVQVQPLTADQLAQILGVNAWTAKYSGGPIECWLEIEEEGQSTLPKRLPEKDFLGAGLVNPPAEGTIDLSWTLREDRQGGQLSIHAGNGGYGYGLGKDSLTFAWPGFGARITKIGNGELVNREPGNEFTLLDYDATESLPEGEKKTPRRVHLKLMGRFAARK
jgi:hypothetical protein